MRRIAQRWFAQLPRLRLIRRRHRHIRPMRRRMGTGQDREAVRSMSFETSAVLSAFKTGAACAYPYWISYFLALISYLLQEVLESSQTAGICIATLD